MTVTFELCLYLRFNIVHIINQIYISKHNDRLHSVINFKHACPVQATTIRMAKKMYLHRTFNLYKGDIKKTWLIINETLSNKKTSDLSQSFRIGNKLISDPNEIANELNKYFINIGKQILKQIVPTQSFQSYLTSPTNKRFKLMEVDDNEIMRIVNNLKNISSYGYDCISNLLMKRAKNELIKQLTLIIN